MNLVENSSGVLQVQDPNDLGLLKEEHLIAEKAGYFYTYLMNSSSSEVNFDEYKITYIRPKVRAINHYYPYGLQMYGLDQLDKDYKYKYTGKELQTDDILDLNSSGLELYDIEARYYDPATGLWHVPDPAEQFSNPYLALGNNPVMYVDRDGEFVLLAAAIFLGATSNFLMQGFSGNINSAGDALLSLGIGAASGAAGFGAGAVVGGGSGFISSAIQSATSAAAGGFVTGAGNTWATGGDFGTGISNGFKTAGLSAGIAAVTGGVMGGIKAKADPRGLGFWSGKPKNILNKTLPTLEVIYDPKYQQYIHQQDPRFRVAQTIMRTQTGSGGFTKITDFSNAQISWIQGANGGNYFELLRNYSLLTFGISGAAVALAPGGHFNAGIYMFDSAEGINFGFYGGAGYSFGGDVSLGFSMTEYSSTSPLTQTRINGVSTSHTGSIGPFSLGQSNGKFNSIGVSISPRGIFGGYRYDITNTITSRVFFVH